MAFQLRDYLVFLIACHGLLIVVWMAIGFPSAFVGPKAALLAIALDAVLIGALIRLSPQTRPIVVIVALTVLIFVQIRTAALTVLPSEALGFIQILPPSPEEVVATLIAMTAGTAAFFGGLQAWALLFPKPQESPPDSPELPFLGLVVFWFGSIAVAVLVIFQLRSGQLPAQTGWLTRLFEADVALLITVVWLTVYKPQSRTYALLGWALISFWLVLSIFGGSRGGTVRIATLVIIALSLVPAVRIGIGRAIGFMIIVGTLSIATAFGGHAIRLSNVTGGSGIDAALHDVGRQDIYVTIAKVDADRYQGLAGARTARFRAIENETGSVFSQETRDALAAVTQRLNPIIVRLASFDYALVTITRPGDDAILDTYIRSTYALKRFLNALVPGTPFPEADLSTAQLFTVAYRSTSLEHARENYLSEPWTIWGLGNILFGQLGGVVVLAVYGLCLQAAFQWLERIPHPVNGIVRTGFLFIIVHGSIVMYGIDHTLQPVVHYTISTLSALCMIYCVRAISRGGCTS